VGMGNEIDYVKNGDGIGTRNEIDYVKIPQ
jgi:hypothetical protein